MAHIEVVDAIETHVRDRFTAAPVFIENDGEETPADGTPFLTVGFPWARSDQASIGAPGSNYWREEGAFTLTVALPRGSGSQQGRLWLALLADSFRGKEIGPVRCAAPQSPVADDDRRSPYFELMMTVPYTFDLVG